MPVIWKKALTACLDRLEPVRLTAHCFALTADAYDTMRGNGVHPPCASPDDVKIPCRKFPKSHWLSGVPGGPTFFKPDERLAVVAPQRQDRIGCEKI